MRPDRVVFWDIDGTLLTTRRAGVFALEEAAREVCGTSPDFGRLQTAGLTDHEVAVLAIGAAGIEADAELANRFLRSYERHLPDRLGLREGGPLPGVVPILDDLRDRPEVLSVLLTGNTRPGAAAKLAHYALEDYFDDGVFCMDGESRNEIARRALALAGERASGVAAESMFVIGDTPHDVRCGKQIGARTVAVASGTYSVAELEAAEPWLVLGSLPPPAEFASQVLGCGAD